MGDVEQQDDLATCYDATFKTPTGATVMADLIRIAKLNPEWHAPEMVVYIMAYLYRKHEFRGE